MSYRHIIKMSSHFPCSIYCSLSQFILGVERRGEKHFRFLLERELSRKNIDKRFFLADLGNDNHGCKIVTFYSESKQIGAQSKKITPNRYTLTIDQYFRCNALSLFGSFFSENVTSHNVCNETRHNHRRTGRGGSCPPPIRAVCGHEFGQRVEITRAKHNNV